MHEIESLAQTWAYKSGGSEYIMHDWDFQLLSTNTALH